MAIEAMMGGSLESDLLLATGRSDAPYLEVFNITKESTEVTGIVNSQPNDINFSPRSKYLGVGTLSGSSTKLSIIDTITWTIVVEISAPWTLRKITFSPDENYVAIGTTSSSASSPNNYAVYELPSGNRVSGLPNLTGFCNGIAWSNDSSTIFLGADDGVFLAVEISTGSTASYVDFVGGDDIDDLQIHPDGEKIIALTSGSDPSFRVLDLVNNLPIPSSTMGITQSTAIGFTDYGDIFLWASGDGLYYCINEDYENPLKSIISGILIRRITPSPDFRSVMFRASDIDNKGYVMILGKKVGYEKPDYQIPSYAISAALGAK